ncbi:MAG: PLP-dependent aminotransferase family protein [Pirellulaceae bacterium]
MADELASQSTLERIAFSRRADLSSGQPIGKLMEQALKFPDLVSLAAGFVDNATLPCHAVARCMTHLASDEATLRKALQYDSAAGNLAFRQALMQWSYRDYPDVTPDPERVILTAGSNQFLHLLAEALVDPGDIVLAASPTYFVFMGTLRGVEARVVGVRADEDGLCLDALEEQLNELAAAGDAARVKAIYTVTEFDNPAGSTLSLERRQRLLEIVARWRSVHGPLLIISDNAYRQLSYEGAPPAPLLALHCEAADFVIELGTFSKSFSPGIRVGWGVVPNDLAGRLLEIKSNMDFGSPHFSQVLLHQALVTGELDRHLPVIRAGYQVKLQSMLDALDTYAADIPGVSWRKPKGGLYVWLTLPDYLDASEQGPLWAAAVESGVLYVPGHYCFPTEGEPVRRNTIRLSFGVQTSTAIADGIRRLCDAIRKLEG